MWCVCGTPHFTSKGDSTTTWIIPWPLVKVGADLCELQGHTLLVVSDYYSNFIEVENLHTTTTRAVFKAPKVMFARYGVPDTLLTDNGPQFWLAEFSHIQCHHPITRSPMERWRMRSRLWNGFSRSVENLGSPNFELFGLAKHTNWRSWYKSCTEILRPPMQDTFVHDSVTTWTPFVHCWQCLGTAGQRRNSNTITIVMPKTSHQLQQVIQFKCIFLDRIHGPRNLYRSVWASKLQKTSGPQGISSKLEATHFHQGASTPLFWTHADASVIKERNTNGEQRPETPISSGSESPPITPVPSSAEWAQPLWRSESVSRPPRLDH